MIEFCGFFSNANRWTQSHSSCPFIFHMLYWGSLIYIIKQYEVFLSCMLIELYSLTSLHRSDFIPYHYRITKLSFLPNYEWFPWNICHWGGMPLGEAHFSEQLNPSHFGLANVYFVEITSYPKSVVLLPDYAFRTSPGTLAILHYMTNRHVWTYSFSNLPFPLGSL